MISKAARRYANALLQSAIEQKNLDDVVDDIRFIRNTLDGSRDLIVFLRSPVIESEVKLSILLSIFKSHISELSIQLLKLLSEKNREALLPDLCEGFIELYNNHCGIVKIDVTTAFEMDQKQQNSLHQQLEKRTGKTVKMHVDVDSGLVGGLVVKIGDTVIDGSVKHKIRMLKNQFAVDAAVKN